MRVLFKFFIAIAILLVVFLLFGAYVLSFHIPEPKGIPIDVTVEINHFQELVRHANKTKDISICHSLPEPQERSYDFSNIKVNPPSQNQWITYCEAVVNEDPSLCNQIEDIHYRNPDLPRLCKSIFESSN